MGTDLAPRRAPIDPAAESVEVPVQVFQDASGTYVARGGADVFGEDFESKDEAEGEALVKLANLLAAAYRRCLGEVEDAPADGV